MKILSWNIFIKNKRLDEALGFLESEDFDVACLQEVPDEGINRVKEFPLNVHVTHKEFTLKNGTQKTLGLVILSKHTIEHADLIDHEHRYEGTKKSKRYRHFNSDSHFVDISAGGKAYRIFNTHLMCVAGPMHRLSQLNEIMEHLDAERINIVCGDFNSFSKPLFEIVLWFFSWRFTWKELFMNEKRMLNNMLKEWNFENVFHRSITFSKFPFQLDYILVPQGVPIKNKKVLKQRYGSDHRPIVVEI